MTVDTVPLRRALVEQLSDAPIGPGWGAAVEAVPRELFLGTAVYQSDGTRWEPVRRAEVAEEEWMGMVYSDRTWVTQVDGYPGRPELSAPELSSRTGTAARRVRP